RPRQLTKTELQQWQFAIAQANYNNILCHCKQCDLEWVASTEETPCQCGSHRVEHIACWQFPDG
ncbi:MAG: hypothetical protein AAF921_21320, partial [Cyanobacteria bacterium P01_D01_bin.44]